MNPIFIAMLWKWMRGGFVVSLLLAAALPADALVARSGAARRAFAKTHACPATGLNKLPCAGFVIDHIKARACGGPDIPQNMQWQTIADGKAKDKIERLGCNKKGKK